MSPLAAFVVHADLFQDFRRRWIVGGVAGEDSMQFQSTESKLHDGCGRLRKNPVAPVRDADPVAKFSVAMIGLDAHSDTTAKEFTFAQKNADTQALTAQHILPRNS